MNKLVSYSSMMAAGLALSSPLFAEPVSKQGDVSSEELSSVFLEEVVVTARRREESLMDVPESISVFGETAIADAEIDEIADFAALTPGVVVQQGFQGGDRPIVVFRGIGQIGGSAPSVVILSDGIYAPNGDPLRNQLYDIQQIEVVKGPQGSLYGRDAIGGVVNVISKPPEEELNGAVQATYMPKAGQESVKGVVNIPLVEDKLYARLSGGYLESDGFFENATGQDHDFRDESYARVKLLYTPNDTTDVDFRFGYNKYENSYNAAFFANSDDVYYDDVGSLNAVDYTDGFNEREVFDAAVKVNIGFEGFEFTSITQLVDSEQNLVQDADFGFLPGGQLVRDSLTNDKTWSQELRLTSDGDDPLRWLVGVFYEANELEFEREDTEIISSTLFSRSSNSVETERYAVFSQFDYDLNEKITLSGALRFDHAERDLDVSLPIPASENFNSERVTPKGSITYALSDDVSVYATYAEGFRSGGFDPVTNIPYEDEDLTSKEIGLKSSLLDGRMNLTVAAYLIDYTEQQVAVLTTDPVTNALIVTTENLGASETKGVELAIDYRPSEHWLLSLSADVMDTEITKDPDSSVEGNSTPFSTDYTISASVQHNREFLSDLMLVSRFAYYYQGDQTWDKGNDQVQESYGTATARFALEHEKWSVSISGENLFNTEYNDQIFANFAIPGLNAVYPGLPRRWTLSASVRF